MNLLELFMKLFLGQGQASTMINPAEIGNQILGQLKKILKSLMILTICVVIFCLLMGYLIDRVLTQMDLGAFQFTNSIIFLLVLIGINLVVMAASLKKAEAKEEVEKERLPAPTRMESPLETAIAALIFDYVKERETKRSTPPTTEN